MRAKLIIFLNILSVIRVSLLETVHFTNSPNKLLKATNYTTYKVDVPNGESITIIEANQPLIDQKIKFDNIDKYSDRRNQVMDLESTLSMTVTPNRNYEYENSAVAVASSTGDEESVTNDYSNLSHERNQKRKNTMMKTVYSPELLQKFLKDYANKIVNNANGVASTNSHQESSGSLELEQANENNNDKYGSIETGDETPADDDEGNRRVSSTNTDDEKESGELNDIQQRKNYRPNGNYNSNQHPYNKNNGWVTLDAVPWSKSKVSKWQSNVKRFGSNYNYQNGNNYGARPPSPYRPSSSNYDYDYNGGGGSSGSDNDDYYSSRPGRPTFHNNQYYGPSHHQSSRPPPPPPPPPPQDNFYQSAHHSSSSFHHSGGGSGNDYDNRPGRPEIITDNRPSNFPSHHEEHHRPSYNQRPNYHESSHHSGGGGYHSYKEDHHPQTYPHNGDGEWVLVSTTKGYQFPKRSGQRAMSFVAQNGFSQDKKYTDSKGIITAAASQKFESFLRPHRAGPTKMSQQQVKLTVLPLFVNKDHENNPDSQQLSDDVNMSVYRPGQHSYDGLIESAQSNQTVEESAANANAGESNAVTVNKSKKKRKVMKNYLMRKSSGGGADSTAMIAAVGASLLPASLGLIAPMVLG